MMIGRDVTASHYATHGADPASATRTGRAREKALSVENVTMGGVVKNMSFSVFAARSSACSAWSGAGRSEIAQVICGARKRNFLRGGMIYLRGSPVQISRAAAGDPGRHRLHHRGSEGRWFLRDHDGRPEHIISDSCRRRAGSTLPLFATGDEADRGHVDQGAVHFGAEAQSQDRGIFRRQPAEGRGGEVARAGAVNRDLRRADARRRRLRDPADPRGDPKARRRRQGGRW